MSAALDRTQQQLKTVVGASASTTAVRELLKSGNVRCYSSVTQTRRLEQLQKSVEVLERIASEIGATCEALREHERSCAR